MMKKSSTPIPTIRNGNAATIAVKGVPIPADTPKPITIANATVVTPMTPTRVCDLTLLVKKKLKHFIIFFCGSLFVSKLKHTIQYFKKKSLKEKNSALTKKNNKNVINLRIFVLDHTYNRVIDHYGKSDRHEERIRISRSFEFVLDCSFSIVFDCDIVVLSNLLNSSQVS